LRQASPTIVWLASSHRSGEGLGGINSTDLIAGRQLGDIRRNPPRLAMR
jgi:hypothetical protein